MSRGFLRMKAKHACQGDNWQPKKVVYSSRKVSSLKEEEPASKLLTKEVKDSFHGCFFLRALSREIARRLQEGH